MPVDTWRQWDVATLDREYSPSSMIPDINVELDRYAQASAAARATSRFGTVAYGTHPSETIDLFMPGHAPRGVLVYFHGGYWQMLSKRESSFMATSCVSSGWAVAVVDYQLAPSRSVAAIIDQCEAATRHLLENRAALSLAGPIVVGGSSAGGHLAAWMMSRVDEVDAAIVLSGAFDLRPLVPTPTNDALGLTEHSAAAVSITADALGRSRPLIVGVGRIETGEFIRQSTEFAAAAGNAGHDVQLHIVEDRNHFDLPFDLGDPERPVGRAMLALSA